MSNKVDVIIPSYNGRHLLEKNLPFLTKNTPNLGKIIVIDNGSTDNTVAWLKDKYPQSVLVRNKTNLGFTKPVNQGVAASGSDFSSLNNDVGQSWGIWKDVHQFLMIHRSLLSVSMKETLPAKLRWSGGKVCYQREDKAKSHFQPGL
jgi:glycosyltransferase involved in cell wall biosynthesis